MEVALCELYHPRFHGIWAAHPCLYTSFLYTAPLSLIELYGGEYTPFIEDRERAIGHRLRMANIGHPYLDNYIYVARNNIFGGPQLVKRYHTSSGHVLCIIHTIWLRLLQRKWKSVYTRRLNHRKSLASLWWRSIHGQWPPQN